MLNSVSQSIPIVHVTSTDRFPKTLLLKLAEPASPDEHFVLAYNVSMDDVGTLFTSSGAVASRDCKIAMRSFTLEIVGKDKNQMIPINMRLKF